MKNNALQDWRTLFMTAVERAEAPAGLLRAGGNVPAAERFMVYANQARIGCIETLAAVYPATQRLVGQDFFENMAALYVSRHPMKTPNVLEYGGDLPAFIATFEPLSALPYLPDVARLEWACHASLHAGHGEPPQPGEKVTLAPHVRLIHSPYPIGAIWDFALRASPLDERLQLDLEEPAYLVVARPALDVEVSAVAPNDWQWLASLTAGDTTYSTRCETWADTGLLSRADPALLVGLPARARQPDDPATSARAAAVHTGHESAGNVSVSCPKPKRQ